MTEIGGAQNYESHDGVGQLEVDMFFLISSVFLTTNCLIMKGFSNNLHLYVALDYTFYFYHFPIGKHFNQEHCDSEMLPSG